MDTETMPLRKAHHGRNVKRLREMFGVKQEAIALELDITQQHLSRLEQKEVIEDELLEKIAKALNVSAEAIKNMNDEAAINYINTFHDNNGHGFFSNNANFSFNPIDKIVELYERMLKAEQEKVEMFQKIVDRK